MCAIVILQALSLFLVSVPSLAGLHAIYIDPTAGNDTKECHASNSAHLPCKTLNYAFEYRNDSTQYNLSPDSTLILGRNVSVFENLHMLALVGSNSTIICGERIGLAFVNVSSISFTDITLLYCSALRNSTSRNFFTPAFSLYQFNVGLYFYLCQDVSMTRVSVNSSQNATGVVMYDTVGRNVIQNSIFANNSVKEGVPGGGGLYVEFSYCIPGDNQCNDIDNKTSNHNAFYSFDGCSFINNTASNKGTEDGSTYIVPYRSNNQAFGRGGGLSVFIRGTASGNVFKVTNCLFLGNSAQWGGGFFFEMHDESANNSMLISNCTFSHNTLNYTLDTGTGGGGLRIGHYVFNYYWDMNLPSNRAEVLYCNFSYNSAMYGGGLAISPTLQGTERGHEAIVRLVGLNFYGNTGKIGAALHVGLFPLITEGIVMNVMVLNCAFYSNNAQYADLLNKTNVPHMIGMGAVYINQVPVVFQGENVFYDNSGTALAVAGCPVDFAQSYTVFSNNSGYRGGAISLLGSTYILINDATRLDFLDNTATDKGGAIYNKYIEMDNLMTQPNCFVRHTNPFLNPDDWLANFTFSNNRDLNGDHNNSIHTSSVLPCARAGGNGYIVRKSDIFCWSRWNYYDKQFAEVDCLAQITSEAGQINLTAQHDAIQVIPGRQFKIPLNITDDSGNDLARQVVFSSTSNASGSQVDYFWGGNATLSGPEGARIQLKFDSLGDRIWHINLETELLPCPPGQKPTVVNDNETVNTVCTCSNKYLGAVSCDPDTLKVKMNDKNWIGKLQDSDKYLVGSCPPAFCQVTETSFITLPNSSKMLSEFICNINRTGVLCGECTQGYGPAVNSKKYECVNCTDINLAANIAKYVATIYLPLGVLFTVLIVFDIRLTTGPANAFILYAQAVSSTLSLDADGHIPLNRLNISIGLYNALLKGYKIVYGIFNLEFFENLLPPFCLSSAFDTLTVLSLDYGIAFFPLVMIVIVVICLKLSECLPCSLRSCVGRLSDHTLTKYYTWKRNVNEALLPAFAAFLLLSYTKFSLTSSYIMGLQSLIDEDGTTVHPRRVYYAGQYDSATVHYRTAYLLPSALIFAIFVCITPLLLLSYPLTLLESCLSKVRFLWRFYPTDRVHVFLDTFQGCFRNRMRFFAGLYFLFRLVINVSYIATDSWPQRFIIQQVACVIMVTLIAACRPYVEEKKFFNYVDIFIFANLAIINSLSFYLYTTSLNGQPPPMSAFVLQYVLVFLPLVYMVAYLVWYVIVHRHQLLRLVPQNYKRLNTGKINRVITRSEVIIDELNTEQREEEALFARARVTNQYRHAIHEDGVADMDEYPSGPDVRETDFSNGPTRDQTIALSYDRVVSNGYGTMSSTNPSGSSSGRSRSSKCEEDEGAEL